MDLFNWYYNEPQSVINLVNRMQTTEEQRGLEYEDLKHFKSELNKLGYTFDYGLDAVPLNLRKL